MIERLGARPSPGRRRRRPRAIGPGGEEPGEVPLGRATAVRAQAPFGAAEEAETWLGEAAADDRAVDELVAEALALLNRALHARTVAGADPLGAELDAERALAVRIGYGSGEEVAGGRFTAARAVDARAVGSPRALRERDLSPQERLAAILGGRESPDACETLLLRARADLDAGRSREAALQLRVALEALLSELADALADPGHEEDMAELGARRAEAGEAANRAIRGDLDPERERRVRELTELCERVIRRRRILRG